jgi:hypothetical protein
MQLAALLAGFLAGVVAGRVYWGLLGRFVSRWPNYESPQRAFLVHLALRWCVAVGFFGGLAAVADASVLGTALAGFLAARWLESRRGSDR